MRLKQLILMTIAVLIVIGISSEAKADFGWIAGTVKDFDTGLPVDAATVTIEGSRMSALTDADGRFQLDKVKVGQYTLLVERVGYFSARADVTVRADRESWVAFRIEQLDLPQEQRAGTSQALSEKEESNYKDLGNSAADLLDVRAGADFGLSMGTEALKRRDRTQKPAPPIAIPEPVPDECDFDWYEPPRQPYDMFFKDYGTNRFVDTRRDRFSTFAIDVDDASYTLAREYLMGGNMPDPAAIRVEEFINHFDYGYKPPDRKQFRVFHELTPSPFGPTTVLKIGIKGQEVTRRERLPLNLTFVIDVSGSMGYDNRMELVKESLRMLVNQLRPTDRVGIVAYGDRARVVLQPVDASRRDRIFRAISGLHPGGSTYAEAGLKLGYEMANRQYDDRRTNRLILCSDGVANVGQTSPDAIMRDIQRFANQGLTLTTFGYGMGNYNDVLLEQLAIKGNGKYAYVNDREEARKLFVSEFVSHMEMLARDVKIQVEFDPQTVRSYRLIGYENRDVADHRFRDNRQDGGEIGAGHEVTALYELQLNKRGRRDRLATVFVRWTDPNQGEVTELSQDIDRERSWKSFDRSRPELRLALVAGQFAELLKGTVYASESSFAELYRVAVPVAEEMGDDQSAELLQLIRQAEMLSGYHVRYDGRR